MAFDLARRTGWAYAPPSAIRGWQPFVPLIYVRGNPDGVVHGAEDVCQSGLPHQTQFVLLYDWCRSKLRKYQPRVVVMEKPLMHHRDLANQRTNIGYQAILLLCLGLTLPESRVWEINNSSCKKHFTGKGNAKKKDMIAACDERGWDIVDDNDADAMALLDFAICELTKPEESNGGTTQGMERRQT